MCYVVNVKTIIAVAVGIVGAGINHLAFVVQTHSHIHWQSSGITNTSVGR